MKHFGALLIACLALLLSGCTIGPDPDGGGISFLLTLQDPVATLGSGEVFTLKGLGANSSNLYATIKSDGATNSYSFSCMNSSETVGLLKVSVRNCTRVSETNGYAVVSLFKLEKTESAPDEATPATIDPFTTILTTAPGPVPPTQPEEFPGQETPETIDTLPTSSIAMTTAPGAAPGAAPPAPETVRSNCNSDPEFERICSNVGMSTEGFSENRTLHCTEGYSCWFRKREVVPGVNETESETRVTTVTIDTSSSTTITTTAPGAVPAVVIQNAPSCVSDYEYYRACSYRNSTNRSLINLSGEIGLPAAFNLSAMVFLSNDSIGCEGDNRVCWTYKLGTFNLSIAAKRGGLTGECIENISFKVWNETWSEEGFLPESYVIVGKARVHELKRIYFRNLAPGTYSYSIRAPGYPEAYSNITSKASPYNRDRSIVWIMEPLELKTVPVTFHFTAKQWYEFGARYWDLDNGEIVLVNETRGLRYSEKTNSTGYVVLELIPAKYDLTATWRNATMNGKINDIPLSSNGTNPRSFQFDLSTALVCGPGLNPVLVEGCFRENMSLQGYLPSTLKCAEGYSCFFRYKTCEEYSDGMQDFVCSGENLTGQGYALKDKWSTYRDKGVCPEGQSCWRIYHPCETFNNSRADYRCSAENFTSQGYQNLSAFPCPTGQICWRKFSR
ncbi:MAG: hypothetical protein V1820_06050 [archaeon]